MKRRYRDHAWMNPVNPWATKDGGSKDTIAERTFLDRLRSSREFTYAEAASLARPLVEFYEEISRAEGELYIDLDTRCRDEAAEMATLVKRHFVNGLGASLFDEPFLSAPLGDVFKEGATKELIGLVLDPRNTERAGENREILWALCLNGSTDLYRSTLTLFRLKHLRDLNVATSDLGTIELALLVARVAINYAEYVYAISFCRRLTAHPSPGDLPGDRLRCYVKADRIRADAEAYLNFEKSRELVDLSFSAALMRLNVLRTLTGTRKGATIEVGHWDAYERDLLSTWLRAASLVRVFNPPESEHSLSQIGNPDASRIDRFATLLGALRKYDDDPSLANRFVHFDALARSKAILGSTAEDLHEAIAIYQKAIHMKFIGDEREKDILVALGKGSLQNKHKRYRIASTRILLYIQQARNPSDFNKRTAIRRALFKIDRSAEKIGVGNMFHARIELELLRALVLQVESYHE